MSLLLRQLMDNCFLGLNLLSPAHHSYQFAGPWAIHEKPCGGSFGLHCLEILTDFLKTFWMVFHMFFPRVISSTATVCLTSCSQAACSHLPPYHQPAYHTHILHNTHTHPTCIHITHHTHTYTHHTNRHITQKHTTHYPLCILRTHTLARAHTHTALTVELALPAGWLFLCSSGLTEGKCPKGRICVYSY